MPWPSGVGDGADGAEETAAEGAGRGSDHLGSSGPQVTLSAEGVCLFV